MGLKRLIDSVAEVFYPRLCPVCGERLVAGERSVCLSCLSVMPRVEIAQGGCPDVERMLLGSRLVERAVSMFEYHRASPYAEILKDAKYRNSPRIVYDMARLFMRECCLADFSTAWTWLCLCRSTAASTPWLQSECVYSIGGCGGYGHTDGGGACCRKASLHADSSKRCRPPCQCGRGVCGEAGGGGKACAACRRCDNNGIYGDCLLRCAAGCRCCLGACAVAWLCRRNVEVVSKDRLRLARFFARLALSFDKIGCGSEMQNQINLFCASLALTLSLNKIGCGSEKQNFKQA